MIAHSWKTEPAHENQAAPREPLHHTDDIDAIKKRLKEKGIPFSDFGAWAMKGWDQIFLYDPDGNVIEVHQVRE